MSKRIRTKHVTLKTYPFRHEAELDKAYLVSNGIRVILQGDDLSGITPGRVFGGQGVRLLIPKNQAEQALELLKKAAKTAGKKETSQGKSGGQKQENNEDS
ncbi:hypothetical protein ES707_09964 [subsurface metagenome]